MNFKKQILIFIGGLLAFGASSATTIKVEDVIINAHDMTSVGGIPTKIAAALRPARLMPEFQVGNGTRPGAIKIEEGSDSSDDTSEDIPSEKADT